MKRIHALALLGVSVLCPLAPAAGQIAILSDAIAEHNAAPGDRYQGALLIRNPTKEPQEARVYQTDYAFAADGRASYGKPGSSPRSNARWMTLSQSYVVIPPETTVPINYSVVVPTDSSLRGTYWSMVMVEAITPGSVESRRPNARVQIGLSVATRYGTQIATDIGQSGISKLAFDSLGVTTNEDGKRGLRFDFINTGERAHRFTMSLELYNDAGELIKKATQTRGLLYPGTAARQTFDVGTIPHGAYTAVLVADGGGDQVFGGQFKVTY